MAFLPAVKEEVEESSLKSEVRKMIFSFKFVRTEISKRRSMGRSYSEWKHKDFSN